jgi:hypothetical protein
MEYKKKGKEIYSDKPDGDTKPFNIKALKKSIIKDIPEKRGNYRFMNLAHLMGVIGENPVKIEDFSEDGIRFVSNLNHRIGGRYHLFLSHKLDNQLFEIEIVSSAVHSLENKSEVLYPGISYVCGAKFIELTPKRKRFINILLEAVLKEEYSKKPT